MNNLEYRVQESQRHLYSIPLEDFQAEAPANPQIYGISIKITRDTFASVLIDSFRNSRGTIGAQYMFFDWLMENNGFDYRISLGNFMSAGGWARFSSQEQDMFLAAFRRVPAHSRYPLTGREIGEDVIRELHHYVKRLSFVPEEEEYEPEYPVPGNEPLSGMPIQKLRQAIDVYLKELKRTEVEINNS